MARPVGRARSLSASWCRSSRGDGPGGRSVVTGFGNGEAGCFLIDDGLVLGERGGECVDGEVVHGPGVAAGGVVDHGDRVAGEQGVGATGDAAVGRPTTPVPSRVDTSSVEFLTDQGEVVLSDQIIPDPSSMGGKLLAHTGTAPPTVVNQSTFENSLRSPISQCPPAQVRGYFYRVHTWTETATARKVRVTQVLSELTAGSKRCTLPSPKQHHS
jgi:hypothetical protein